MKFMFSASLHVLSLLFYLSYLLPVPGGSEGCKFSEGWFVQIVPSETELSFLGDASMSSQNHKQTKPTEKKPNTTKPTKHLQTKHLKVWKLRAKVPQAALDLSMPCPKDVPAAQP